jgi:hypothetical protein
MKNWLFKDCGPHRCRAAKGVGKKMTAALESLKVGWGGGSGAAFPSSGPATPKGTVISKGSGFELQGQLDVHCNKLYTPVLALLRACTQGLGCGWRASCSALLKLMQ